MNTAELKISGSYHRPLVFNAILWSVIFLVLLYSFSHFNSPKKIDYIYTGSFLVTIIIPVLINLYLIIPIFLKKERYLLFALFFVINILAFTLFNRWVFNSLIDYVFPDYFFISYYSIPELTGIFFLFLTGTSLLKLAEDWIHFNTAENRQLKIKNQQIQMQLASLRAQINPHFLFNSLNVIYALALENKKTTKDAIVQLSEVLRYIIYDSNTSRVTLKEEVLLLKNFIGFQKYRKKEGDKIQFREDVENEDFSIYPMLLLPLVENSFKHGVPGKEDENFISIDFIQKGEEFHFRIENHISGDTEGSNGGYSGVGLTNLKKNLEIVYPDTHELEIKRNNNVFSVSLKLFRDAS
ncbi:sensor histidine kinase [Muriicola marianensis]|uniref:Histidine kinase n=1 Tax=Muriicola marianensis TaxID=1324801 RepID=A0ABQ1QWN8_9FLAO|nr:sensor histidine kinase [Muriicola marianensis]GGD45954.1 histidine kinase [Muriicola marianensis]